MDNIPTRLQNPGDLRFIGQEGATQDSSGFAKFEDPKQGYGALLNDLQAKINRDPSASLADFSNTYAPASDGNDPAQYTANLANQLKVSPDTPIGSLQNNLGGFAEAVAKNEGYQGANQPTPQPTSSRQSDWLTTLEGLGGAALGWLGNNLGGIAKNTLPWAAGIGVGALTESPIAGLATEQGVSSLLGGNSGGQPPQTPPPTAQGTPAGQPQGQPQFSDVIPQSTMASGLVRDAINETMGSTQPNRVFANSDKGKDAINTAAMFGLVNPDENGNLMFDEEKRAQLESDIAKLDDAVIKAEGGSGKMMSVSNLAGSYIGKDLMSTDQDKQKAAKIVQQNIRATRIPMNGEMDLSGMRTRQKQHYAAAQGGYGKGLTSPEILAHKALGNAYGSVIGQSLKNPELHKKVLGMERSLINAKQLGKKIHGKKAPQKKGLREMFLRQGARAAEIYIGDKIGGPVGAIIGGFVGENLNRRIEKRFGRNIFETKGMKAAMDILHETKPKEYTMIVDALQKQGVNFTPEQEGEVSEPADVEKDVRGDLKTIQGKIQR